MTVLLGSHKTFILSLHFCLYSAHLPAQGALHQCRKNGLPQPREAGNYSSFHWQTRNWGTREITDLLEDLETLAAELGENPNVFSLTAVPENWQGGSCTRSAQCCTAAKSNCSVPGHAPLSWSPALCLSTSAYSTTKARKSSKRKKNAYFKSQL